MYIAFYPRMTYAQPSRVLICDCASLCAYRILSYLSTWAKGRNLCYPFDLNHSCIFLFHFSLIFLLGKKMAITLIPCFVSHSWTKDLVENIDFLMLQHCSLLFWIGGTILVLGAEFRIQN